MGWGGWGGGGWVQTYNFECEDFEGNVLFSDCVKCTGTHAHTHVGKFFDFSGSPLYHVTRSPRHRVTALPLYHVKVVTLHRGKVSQLCCIKVFRDLGLVVCNLIAGDVVPDVPDVPEDDE